MSPLEREVITLSAALTRLLTLLEDDGYLSDTLHTKIRCFKKQLEETRKLPDWEFERITNL